MCLKQFQFSLPNLDCAGGRGDSNDPRIYIDCVGKESSLKTNIIIIINLKGDATQRKMKNVADCF